MRILRNIAVSLSLYSKIPMPQFPWEEKDMEHILLFLPWVGAVIGLCSALLFHFAQGMDPLILVGGFSLLPLLITGGFHLDGFMDVEDALHSYQPKEKKLLILKDPHIGAFSVISLLTYSLAWGCAMLFFLNRKTRLTERRFLLYCLIFFIARCACALTCLMFDTAKKEGMLTMERGKKERSDILLSALQLVLALGCAAWLNPRTALAFLGVTGIFTLYYYRLCRKNFGGVTGDTAGYYIVMLELFLLISTGVTL